MAPDEEMGKILRRTKIFQIAFLGIVLTYIIILIVFLSYSGFTPPFDSNDPFLTPLVVALGGLATISLAIGVYVPRRMIKKSRKPQDLFRAHIVRCGIFCFPAHCGLILGILGVRWLIILPFFIAVAGALILTFPTKERWRQMLE